ncbi:hypothetical protein CONLIGDRAFT_716074 [Coniochaeta ligniaria NRRL 30616]|uniref:Amidoligase enzyme n=1 Tax=Coniochaeta ligniaria NRRL 30616 TaxID=1408157 RepID=A0A1J7J2T2_9PEZI|nr:hypothetical protein CONLIGDRAFT_716074 [Coniochaeta ligniaria NRRL 30616]
MSNPAPLRLGLEIEAVFVPKVSKEGEQPFEFAARLAQGYRGKPGMHANIKGHDQWEGDPYVEWEIVKDASLPRDPTNRTFPLEITSPILTFDENGAWREQVKAVFDHVQTTCDITTNKSCGFHVHLSPGDGSWDLEELKRICLAILYFEPAVLALLPVSRQNHHSFLGKNRFGNDNFHELSIESPEDADYLMRNPEDRTSAWNFKNLSEKYQSTGVTIEWKQPPGVTTAEECLAWTEFAVSFVQAARYWAGIGAEIEDSYTPDVEGLQKFVLERGECRGRNMAYLEPIFVGKTGTVSPVRSTQ